MVRYVVDLKKACESDILFFASLRCGGVSGRSKSEQFSVRQMLVLFVLYCLFDLPIDRFGELVKVLDLWILWLEQAPHYTMMWRAWRRFPPHILRKLVKFSGRVEGIVVKNCSPHHPGSRYNWIKKKPLRTVDLENLCTYVGVVHRLLNNSQPAAQG